MTTYTTTKDTEEIQKQSYHKNITVTIPIKQRCSLGVPASQNPICPLPSYDGP